MDQRGTDLLQGLGWNVDHSVTTDVSIVYSGTSDHPRVDESDTLTLKIANNAAVSAEVVIDVYYSVGG